MANGTFYAGIETDPRDSKLPDEKTDLKSLENYQPLSKQKTMLSDKGRAVRPISKGADKYVNKFIEKARAKKKEIAERKAAEGIEADTGADEFSTSTKLAARTHTPKPTKDGDKTADDA